MNCGIYCIKNVLTGDLYIGQSYRMKRRHYEHLWLLSRNEHPNIHLQRAYNVYGENNFSFSVLLYCDKGSLNYYEQAVIDRLQPQYNICTEEVHTTRGLKMRDEIKAKLKEIQQRRDNEKIFTPEVRAKISRSRLGKSMSEELKRKLREYWTGKPATYKRTEETKRKMSEATRGKPKSEEHKEKLRTIKNKYAGTIVISPTGERLTVDDNGINFGRKYGLGKSQIGQLFRDGRCKGWRIDFSPWWDLRKQ